MMLPSNTNMGSSERSSGRQKPLAGQCDPVFALNVTLVAEFLRFKIFFTAALPINDYSTSGWNSVALLPH
jgi:hypothetical protein